MQAFYEQRDLSAIAETPFFKIATVEWGYGFIENAGGELSLADIPNDATGLETVLYENAVDLSYINNTINLRCVLPSGVVAEGETFDVSAINIKDAQGNCIAVSAVLPIPVTSDRILQFDLQIQPESVA